MRDTAPAAVTVMYVDDPQVGPTEAWTRAVIQVIQAMQAAESVSNVVDGLVDEEFWLQRLINAVLNVDDYYAAILRAQGGDH